MLLSGLSLLLILGVPGYSLLLAFGRKIRKKLTITEAFFLMIVIGVLAASWPALILSEIGWFSLPLLLAVLFAGSFLLIGWAIRSKRDLNPFRGMPLGWWSFIALALVGFSYSLSPRPFEYIVGGRDHGIYVNTGVNIARSGGILIHDLDLAAAPAESRRALVFPRVSLAKDLIPGPWSQGSRLPGYTIRDLDEGIVIPHAFHLYPVWIAIFYSLGGLSFALGTTAFFSILGAIAFYFVVARLFDKRVGLLALLLLSVSLAQVWFTQYPSAEILVRFYLWSGLLAFAFMVQTKSYFAAVIAGLCFGFLHLTKLDTLAVPLVLFAFFVYLWFTKQYRHHHWFLLLPYCLLLIHSGIHAFFFATTYLLDQAVHVLLPKFMANAIISAAAGFQEPFDILGRLITQNGLPLLVAIAILLLIAFFSIRWRDVIAQKLESLRWSIPFGRGVLAVALGLAAAVAFFAYPHWQFAPLPLANESLTFVTWYLGPLCLLLGLVGGLQVLASRSATNSPEALDFTWVFLLANMLPLFVLGAGTYSDHFWAIRRFIPVVLPAFIFFAAVLIWELVPKSWEKWPRSLLPLGLLLVLLATFWQKTWPIVRVVDYEGLLEQITQLATAVPDDAVLLFEQSVEANKVTVPLWFLFERTVFALGEEARDDPALIRALDQWRAAGRDVYWISTTGGDLPTWPSFALNYIRTFEIAVPLVERTVLQLPLAVGSYRNPLDLYQLVEESQVLNRRQAITLNLTFGMQDEQVLTGLYDPEVLSGLTPFRRTSEQVVMQMQARMGTPSEILLRMSSGRPPGVPAPEVTVYLNDSQLSTVRVDEDKTLYPIPVSQPISLVDDLMELRLEITPWVPAETGYGVDQRPLGVYLDWVKVIVIEPVS